MGKRIAACFFPEKGDVRAGGLTLGLFLRRLLVFLAMACLFVIWPLKLPEYQGSFPMGGDLLGYVPVSSEAPLSQEFSPALPYLDWLEVALRSPEKAECLHLRVWGFGQSPIFDEDVSFTPQEDGFVRLHLGLLLSPDRKFTLQYMGGAEGAPVEIGVGSEGPVGRMILSGPLTPFRIFFYAAGILLLCAILVLLLKKAEENGHLSRRLSLVRLPYVLAGGLILTGGYGIFVLKAFGQDLANNLFLMLGVIFAACLIPIFYGAGRRGACRSSVKASWLSDGIADGDGSAGHGSHAFFSEGGSLLFGSLCMAGCLISCIAYQNALSDYEHYVFYRSLLLCLGLYLLYRSLPALMGLSPKERKKTFGLLAGVLLLLLIAGGIYIYRSIRSWGDPLLASENAGVFTLYVLLLLIPVFSGEIKKRLQSFREARKAGNRMGGSRKLLLLLSVCYAGMSLIFANGRLWPLVMFLAFGAVAGVCMFYRVPMREYLRELGNGVLLSYGFVVVYALLHRPWHAFILYRYGLVFHTVTMTSVYLLLVITVSVVRLHECWDGSLKGLLRCPLEALCLGSSLAFLLMTYSRNGILSCMIVLLLILFAAGPAMRRAKPRQAEENAAEETAFAAEPAGRCFKPWPAEESAAAEMTFAAEPGGGGAEPYPAMGNDEKRDASLIRPVRRCLRMLFVWCLLGMLAFPVCFSAARILPAVAGRPEMFWIEPFTHAVYRGTPTDSGKYMTIQRFLQVMGIKSRGLPEYAWERSEESNRYSILHPPHIVHSLPAAEIASAPDRNDPVGISAFADMPQGAASRHSGKYVKSNRYSIFHTRICAASGPNRTDPIREIAFAISLQAAASRHSGKDEKGNQAEWLVASLTLPGNPISEEERNVDADQYSNGRLGIYSAYLSQLNLTGHAEMGALLPDGTPAVHAHNIYLQIAFDHGIPTGGLFLILCLFVIWQAFRFRGRSLLPFALGAAFLVGGMAEWISHLCNPLCFAFVFSTAALFADGGAAKE